jgi:hypothetical protein
VKLEELQKQLDEVYESPTFKAIKELEEDRKSILATSSIAEIAKTQQHELEKLIGNSSLQNAFKSVQDYEKYTSPILDSLHKNNFQALHDSLSKSYESLLKPQISETFKTLTESQMKLSDYANIGNLSIDEYLGTSVKSALENIKANESLLDSSKVLNSTFGQIDTNIFKEKINGFEEERKLLETKPYHFHELPNIEIPKNPIFDVIEQNEKIIAHLDLQNKSLNEIAKYLANENEKLDTHNSITEQQIKKNDVSAKKALWIAIISIIISIVATAGAIFTSYDIYNKEDISDNTQHKELVEKIEKSNDSSEQNKLLKELLQEVKIQNKLLLKQNDKINKE